MVSHSILEVIIHYYHYYHSDCPRLGHWNPFKLISSVLPTYSYNLKKNRYNFFRTVLHLHKIANIYRVTTYPVSFPLLLISYFSMLLLL